MQIAGAILILMSFALLYACTLTKRNDKYLEWASIICLVAAARLDIPLFGAGDQTITQYVQVTVREAVGYAIMITYVLTVGIFFGRKKMLTATQGCILGHLFWS